MLKLLTASIFVVLATTALGAPADMPSEPEQTINAIGADVAKRTQWFGDTIDHLLSGTDAPAQDEVAPPRSKKVHKAPQ